MFTSKKQYGKFQMGLPKASEVEIKRRLIIAGKRRIGAIATEAPAKAGVFAGFGGFKPANSASVTDTDNPTNDKPTNGFGHIDTEKCDGKIDFCKSQEVFRNGVLSSRNEHEKVGTTECFVDNYETLSYTYSDNICRC